jgi:taurine dioxygenase
MTIAIEPSGAALGADILGLDLSRPIEEQDTQRLRRAWTDHLVLRVRGAAIDDEAQIRFSRLFGDIEITPAGVLARDYGVRNGADARRIVPPEITVVSNIVENGQPIGDLGSGELEWHTDASFLDDPPAGSALRALEIPPVGGETGFVNMYAALDALPAGLRRRLSETRLLHSRLRSSDGRIRKGYESADTGDPARAPGSIHPAIRVHEATGRPALFLGRRSGAFVVGADLASSAALLDEIWHFAMQDRFVWEQSWRVGDLVLWDNRCTMHRRNAFDSAARRRMHRTQIVTPRID